MIDRAERGEIKFVIDRQLIDSNSEMIRSIQQKLQQGDSEEIAQALQTIIAGGDDGKTELDNSERHRRFFHHWGFIFTSPDRKEEDKAVFFSFVNAVVSVATVNPELARTAFVYLTIDIELLGNDGTFIKGISPGKLREAKSLQEFWEQSNLYKYLSES